VRGGGKAGGEGAMTTSCVAGPTRSRIWKGDGVGMTGAASLALEELAASMVDVAF